jgi:NADH dehydrogenase (ubiquinone) 1 beta subcomplex subunit 7
MLQMSERPLPPVTKAEMDAHRVPANMRDYCVHLLIPLNTCRRANYYMPWKCTDERHAYEKCEYEE